MKTQGGFSLIELLIVIVIIGIVAVIAVPNLLSARRAANEGSVVSALRTLYGANMSYAATVGYGHYAGTAGTPGTSPLNDLGAANLIDQAFGRGDKSGYSFIGDRTAASATESETFYFAANPSTPAGILMTGAKRYGVATDGVIRSDATPANLGTPFDASTISTAQPINN
ncbi:MAG: prepilin-type N-terminal cleavage/methylation domain-containing protein [Acidobacteriota bacterium]